MADPLRAADILVQVKADSGPLGQINKTIDMLQKKIEDLNNVGVKAKGAQKAAHDINGVAHSVNNTREQYSKAATAAERYGLAQQRAAGKAKVYRSISDGWGRVARSTRGATIAIGAGAAYSVKKAMDVQDAYKKTYNLLQTGGEKAAEAQRNVNKMRDDGSKYSIKYGQSQKTIAEGYQELVKRGYTSNQALGAQKSLLQASIASGDDYADVVHGATGALEAFGMRAKTTGGMITNTKKVVNEMAYSADLTATDFQGMSKAMEYVGTAAHQSGFSLHETAAAIGELSNNNIEADKAGTGLRKVITSLQDPSKRAREALGDLGLSVKDFADRKGDMKSFTQIFSMLNEKTKGMAGQEKGKIFFDLFGATGQNAAQVLAQNTKALKDLDDQVARAPKRNYVQQLANKNMTTALAQWKRFKQSINAVAIEFGTTLLPTLTKAMSSLAGLLEKVNQMPKAAKNFTAFGALAIAGIYPAAKIIQTITGAMAGLQGLKASMYGNMAKGALSTTTSTSSSVPVIAGKTGSVANATKAGTSLAAGTAKYVGGRALGVGLTATKSIGYTALASQGIEFGANAVNVFKKGLHGSGVDSAWKMGGQTFGAAVGGLLAGPAGAGYGATFGGYVAEAIHKNEVPNPIKEQQDQKKQDTRQRNRLRQKYYAGNTKTTTDADNANKVLNQIGAKPLQKGYKPNNKQKQSPFEAPKNMYKKLPADAKQAMSQVEKTFTTAQGRIIANAGNSSLKSQRKVTNANTKTFNALKKQLANFSSARETTSKKNLALLVKNGDISKKQAAKQLKTLKKNDDERYKSSKKVIDKVIKAEKNGGDVSQKTIKQANRVISRQLATANGTTSKYAARQKIIYGKLNDSTTKLTAKQGQAIVKSSYNAMQKQISYANKTYTSAKNKAEAKYKAVKKAADYERYVTGTISASQYKKIITNAEKTRSQAIKKADNRRDHTVETARDEHKKVVSEAEGQTKGHLKWVNKETGQTKNAFEDMHDSIIGIIESIGKKWNEVVAGLKTPNAKQMKGLVNATAKTATKNVQTITRFNAGTRFNGGKAAKPKQPKSKLNIQTGFAKGGAIRRNQMAMIGEQGQPEFVYDPRTGVFRLLGQNGPQVAQLHAGEYVLNGRDTSKAMRGGLGRGIKLAGYAKGTTTLDKVKSKTKTSAATIMPKTAAGGRQDDFKNTELTTKRSMKKISDDITKSYDKSTKTSKKHITEFDKFSGKTWKGISKDTDKTTNQIQKSAVGNYDALQKHSITQLKQMNGQNTKQWKGILNDSKHYSQLIQKNTVNDFDDTQKGSNVQMNQMRKQVISQASDTAKGFGNQMDRLPKYAHSSMSNSISYLNKGFAGINSVLGQFGGNKSVLKTVHYATGSNGPVSRDHLATVNDAKAGPKQEAILRRNGQIEVPHGNNAVVALHRGDAVLNGIDTIKGQQAGLIHYAKGAGSKDALRKIIRTNDAHPNKQFNRDFTGKIKVDGTALQKGINTLSKNSTSKYGQQWNQEVWNQMSGAMSGGGAAAGGPWAHTPGGGWVKTNGFGAPRSFGTHDGVDFSGSKTVHAMHGGTVARVGGAPANWGGAQGIGQSIVVRGSDGYQVIYQELNGKANSGAHPLVHVGDTVKTGQALVREGPQATHVHVGVSHGSVWDHGGSSTRGWFDITKMHGKSSGTPKAKKSAKNQSALSKLVKKQIGPQLKWVGKHLVEEDLGSIGSFGLSGSQASRARKLAAALKKLYPAATNAGIAAVLGNWAFESGLNPSARNSSGGASGLGQWLGGRFKNLVDFAKKQGKSWQNPAAQLAFAVKGEGSDSSILRRVLRGGKSVAALAAEFSSEWERGGYTAQHVAGARRIESALSRRNGGKVKKGEIYKAHEKNRGFEIFKPDQNGTIEPHDKALKAVNNAKKSSGTIKVENNITVHAEGNGNAQEIGKVVSQKVADATQQVIEQFKQQNGDYDEGGFII